jgi:hypothetical protein
MEYDLAAAAKRTPRIKIERVVAKKRAA